MQCIHDDVPGTVHLLRHVVFVINFLRTSQCLGLPGSHEKFVATHHDVSCAIY